MTHTKAGRAQKEKGETLTEAEKRRLTFLRLRGATFMLTSAIATCLEQFSGRALPNTFAVSFGPGVGPDEAQTIWAPIVRAAAPFTDALMPAVVGGLQNSELVSDNLKAFESLIEATKEANAGIYGAFANRLVVD